MLQDGAGSECCCLAWHHVRQVCQKETLGEKKKKIERIKAGGCPSNSEIVPPIVEVASLVLCWSPGQIPQFLLDSFSNQFPLNSAEAPFGSSQQELPPS